MKIKKIKINSLYGKLNFEWEFDEKVNILAGINGSYKTTILNIIRQVTNHEEVKYPVSSVVAEYTDGIKLTYTRRISDIQTILDNRESNKVVVEKIEKDHPEWLSGGEAVRNVQVTIVSYREEKNGQDLSMDEYEKEKRIDFISTFDVVSNRDKETVLNAELRRLREFYAFYISDLSKQVSDLFNESGNVNKSQVDAVYKYRNEFISIVNDSFKETGKTMSESSNGLSFQMENGQTVQLFNLSAGEKQLLIILLTALLEKRQDFVLLMDEPEISMHIDMQYTLIDNLMKINPELQLIMSTHSPAIFGSGWGDKVVMADSIMK